MTKHGEQNEAYAKLMSFFGVSPQLGLIPSNVPITQITELEKVVLSPTRLGSFLYPHVTALIDTKQYDTLCNSYQHRNWTELDLDEQVEFESVLLTFLADQYPCHVCHGTGEADIYDSPEDLNPVYTEWCSRCLGRGVVLSPNVRLIADR